MERNIEKILEEGLKIYDKNPKSGTLSLIEFKKLEEATQGKMEAMNNAYLVGLALGYRIGKREAKKNAARA